MNHSWVAPSLAWKIRSLMPKRAAMARMSLSLRSATPSLMPSPWISTFQAPAFWNASIWEST